jgi:DNA-binding ferritin-like protein
MAIFPERMVKPKEENFTLESIASKLHTFQAQIKLIHWKTKNNSQHIALGNLYDYLVGKTDVIIEQLMGYEGKTIEGFKTESPSSKATAIETVKALEEYSHAVYEFGEDKMYCGVELNSQKLSAKCALTLYLLTQE